MDGRAITPEAPGDAPAIRRVLEAAFPTPEEADLVDRLRAAGDLTVSLVALEGPAVVGHVAFSPIRVEGAASPTSGLGLAPLAVAPTHQGRGLGAELVRAGLDACRAAGAAFVVVLGDPAYYRRFGFEPAGRRGLGNAYGLDEPFQALELTPGALPDGGGLARYAPAFDGLADPPRDPE